MIKHEALDLVIVGSGPAGLTAALNAGSEGLSTVVVDCSDQLGGQAGTSSLIENVPGFPGGITGRDLTARMAEQVDEFGARIDAPYRVERIRRTKDGLLVTDGETKDYLGRAVLISSGVDYRLLDAPGYSTYLGRGTQYGSPKLNNTYQGKKLFVVGGANSAGQAAMHLSKFDACEVHLVVRGKTISDKMSDYLVKRVTTTENITIHTETEVASVDGDGYMREVVLRTPDGEQTLPADEIFALIGANPKTHWLPRQVRRDTNGFVVSGGDLPAEVRGHFEDQCGRQPFAHETSVHGIFAAGDVRSESVKRVASAMGEGSAMVSELHRYLKPAS